MSLSSFMMLGINGFRVVLFYGMGLQRELTLYTTAISKTTRSRAKDPAEPAGASNPPNFPEPQESRRQPYCVMKMLENRKHPKAVP